MSTIHLNQSINYLLKKQKKQKLKNPKAFIDYSQTVDDVYENLVDYNPTKKRKVLIVFDDIIADMQSNKIKIKIKLNPIVTELF